MSLLGKKEGAVLLLGDLVAFIVALWLALALRYWSAPDLELFTAHLRAFLPLYLIWVLVFFISDLYRRQTILLSRPEHLLRMLLRAQIINSLLSVVAFYFVPYFDRAGITPKTNLFLHLLCALVLLWLWRSYVLHWLAERRPARVYFACAGKEVEEIKQALTERAQSRFVLSEHDPELIIFDKYSQTHDHLLPDFYRRFFRGTKFVPMHNFYEEVFERVPLSLVNEKWFLENISNQPKRWYALGKRLMDLILGSLLFIFSLPFYLVVPILIKIEDGGEVFYADERIGKGGRKIVLHKFRSMSLESDLAKRHTTKIGRWLRRTRIDELPQLWSVIRGEQSLVGPRPEKSDYAALYRQQIAYYDARHLIAPGLSGWAQLYQDNHPHFQSNLEATAEKLSYDLYYLKNRGWWLDVKIALKTLRTLVSQSGV